MVLGEVKRTFNPEFINRIDEIIVFEALSRRRPADDHAAAGQAAERQPGRPQAQDRADAGSGRLDHRAVTCKDRSYGARPLRRAIQRYVEDPLSEELIRGHLRGGEIEVYLDGGSLAYRPAGEVADGRRLA